MPALTISAVDHTTGQLTITAHGQTTGAGPAALYAAPGGAIPVGLAPVTDYWLIVVDANTVKLADSSAHALVGTALTFTSNGTLPLQLLIGLPYRRPRTAAPGSQAFSSDANATWDSLVELWNLSTGQAQSLWPGQRLVTRTKFPTPIVATNWATVATFGGVGAPWLSSSGAGSAYIDLDIPEGYKLSTLTLMCVGNASANLTIEIDEALNANSPNASLGALVLPALSATAADQTINMLASSAGLSVTVALGGAATYTRSTGSYLTDGFIVGQLVSWTGFVNAGNNVVAAAITALSATVMTLSDVAQVIETGPAGGEAVAVVSTAVDSTLGLQLKLTASATGLAVKSLRYSCVPQ